MRTLTPLSQIAVPVPAADETYRITLLDRAFAFVGLKALLGAADLAKAGERHAGLAARSEVEREAARSLLAGLTLQHLHDRPLTDPSGRVDDVMRANYAIDPDAFVEIAPLTLGALKDRLLRAGPAEVRRLGGGLTGVMAAALAKIMDVHELILVAKKAKRAATARTRVGLPGTLSSRLQPNHPTDDLSCITALVYAGLSMGTGDAILGVNPAVDTLQNVSAILFHLDALRRETGAPTQICVLAHVKTQLACLEQGAPVEILFQSLAGTERTLTEEFDVTVPLLDAAYAAMAAKGPLGPDCNFMYFETGQGSELTYGKHNGIDMTTCEALCYGLARRYDPFMVNNVTGFIGPETHRDNFEMIYSNLQDHFMGKLMGLPMGMAPCYTLHSDITMEGQQMATELLAAAGANFFMDVYLTTDRMLAYFDTSGHDDQTLREVHGLAPAPEFLEWAIGKGIFARDAEGGVVRGPSWGDPRLFCRSAPAFADLMQKVPGAHGFDNAGPRPADAVSRTVRANLAIAREAIHADLDPTRLGGVPFRRIASRAASRADHLAQPDAGAGLDAAVLAELQAVRADVQILVSDGLSAEAIHHNIPDLVPALLARLDRAGISSAEPLLLPFGRVKAAEPVGDAVQARIVVTLIGERPGGDARASRSMSAYLAYRLEDPETQASAAVFSGNPDIRYEYSVISNIYDGGLPPLEAARQIAEKVQQILALKAAGNRLESALRQAA
ncbi:ethanolamine ammonia-lyase subunit EutB [Aquabacter spiritensis]|uniref:Ethanolamine ammonia-lyase light chain /ethanolamine ammonia-lyase heavy chain n=1 Tax=Aquabacter spiritensis TaxID=933073 RepID=A0A4R3M6Y0_9HYPH|nr:ethanolamine ammonia-lyase subunit EutB [Aquabacter spiritensis]TCT08019.1 ethanolamine ammonia-lyase light chain /ethanolamine ammonia-lyase heavy chain [Aquabacter spiritensis]